MSGGSASRRWDGGCECDDLVNCVYAFSFASPPLPPLSGERSSPWVGGGLQMKIVSVGILGGSASGGWCAEVVVREGRE